MSAHDPTLVARELFERAGERALQGGLPYAGAVTPEEAWHLHSRRAAQIVDVRTATEYRNVGHVPETRLIEWRRDNEQAPDPRFIERLKAAYAPGTPLLFLCRSGVRSHYAAEAATRAGFAHAYNVLQGFEGGWRQAGLPWERGDTPPKGT